jgi:hypothetical protein
VPSGSEVSRLLEHAPSLKHRALFMLMYGAGARDLSAKPGEQTGPALLVFPRPSEKAQPCVMAAPSG